MTLEQSLRLAPVLAIAAPALAFALIALRLGIGHTPGERWTARLVALAFGVATLAIAGAASAMLVGGLTEVHVALGAWLEVADRALPFELVLDRLSVPFAGLAAGLVGLTGAFSARYLHRDRGFARFYLLLCLFGAGVELVLLGGSLELVFVGWELVGLTSALLIAFFDERPTPARHGLRAFVIYRVCDVGLLSAAVWLHHSAGGAGLDASERWAGVRVPAGALDATLVGALLLFAALGKSAQIPFGGWLPRAMEGPTPSSAVFYGAISIHLGPYLLLRAAPILERAPLAAGLVIAVGALTALHATFVGRVQTDVKSALAYASMTQVGLIFVEIGLGLPWLAIAHVVGHASLRTLQLLRAPSVLHDRGHLERAMGAELPRAGGHLERLVPARLQPWLYRLALERGYHDALVADRVLAPVVRWLRALDRLEERWIAWLEGRPAKVAREPERGEVVR
ncbi:MAG: proton-conducting membrane transporter [Sandaracinaceae bacterium]|nr:proton-conducting membrane transporter [Sandaracinaceae bacterium]